MSTKGNFTFEQVSPYYAQQPDTTPAAIAPDLDTYDKFLVMFSGGKDSTALVLLLLDLGVPKDKIELWHHDIDGHGPTFMDWECTPAYCRAFARAFGLPIYFSWKGGGFEQEMNRENSLTAPTFFECPTDVPGITVTRSAGGTQGKPGTRRKFPQVSPDLSVRWCSSYLKIDVGATAIRNQDRFNNSRTLVLSGERAEESPARAKYKVFEVDRADSRKGRAKRHVDRWRPIHTWSSVDVWKTIERYSVRAHPAYYLGWGRVSCKFCIFGSANQFASAYAISEHQANRIIKYEQDFGKTIKRDKTLVELIASGTPYEMELEDITAATGYNYDQDIIMQDWQQPSGAYGESCGPV